MNRVRHLGMFAVTLVFTISSQGLAGRKEIQETLKREGLPALIHTKSNRLEEWPRLSRVNQSAIEASSIEAIANRTFLTDVLEGIKELKPTEEQITEATIEEVCGIAAKIGVAALDAGGASNLIVSDSLNRVALGTCAHFLVANPQKHEVVEKLIRLLQVEELNRGRLTVIVKEFPTGYFRRSLSEFPENYTIRGICAAMEGRNRQGMGYVMSQSFKSSQMVDDLELEALSLRLAETKRFLDYGLKPLIELAKRGATFQTGSDPFEVVRNDKEFWTKFPTLDHTPPMAIIEVFSKENWDENRFVSIALE